MWDLNDINAPESEALQSEREIHEDIARLENARAEFKRVQDHPFAGDPGDGDRLSDEIDDLEQRLPDHVVFVVQPEAIIEAAERDEQPVRFKRLRNNAWGITGPSALLREGADVAVTKRDGTTTTATVSRVLWAGDGKAICSIRR